VIENVSLAQVHVHRMARRDADAKSQSWLQSLGVGARSGARPSELSGGEAQRVAIARALATDPPLLLMDEPTASLDPARRGDLAATLVSLASTGRTLLIATHDVPFALSLATRVVVLANGCVVEDGPADGVLTRPSHPATRALLQGDRSAGLQTRDLPTPGGTGRLRP
jgi:ABC-type polar amino acid transport system ATPase subunit